MNSHFNLRIFKKLQYLLGNHVSSLMCAFMQQVPQPVYVLSVASVRTYSLLFNFTQMWLHIELEKT